VAAVVAVLMLQLALVVAAVVQVGSAREQH
jgi:hypothetical protein